MNSFKVGDRVTFNRDRLGGAAIYDRHGNVINAIEPNIMWAGMVEKLEQDHMIVRYGSKTCKMYYSSIESGYVTCYKTDLGV